MRDLVAVHAGQADIAEDDFGLEGSSPVEPVGTVVGNLDDMRAEFEYLAQAVGRVPIVLNDQHPSADCLGPGWACARLLARALVERQLDHELRPLAEAFAVRMNLTAMHLHQALDQRQAKPQATLAAIQGCVGLHEGLEQPAEQRRLDANSAVDDPQDGVSLRRGSLGADPDPPAGRGELGRILQQVSHHLGETLDVAPHRQGPRREGSFDYDCPTLEQGAMVFHRATNQIVQFERTALQLNLVARDARDVEQVVHQARELADLSVDDIEGVLGLLTTRVRAAENVQAVANGRERVAQLV